MRWALETSVQEESRGYGRGDRAAVTERVFEGGIGSVRPDVGASLCPVLEGGQYTSLNVYKRKTAGDTTGAGREREKLLWVCVSRWPLLTGLSKQQLAIILGRPPGKDDENVRALEPYERVGPVLPV